MAKTPKELDMIGWSCFDALHSNLTPAEAMEVCAAIAACVAFSMDEDDAAKPDKAIDLMAEMAKAKRRVLLANFEEKLKKEAANAKKH